MDELDARIARLEIELRCEILQAETRLRIQIAEAESKRAEANSKLIMRGGLIAIVLIEVLAALLKRI